MADNVYSSAKILSKNEEVQKYELGNFINSPVENNVISNSNVVLDDRQMNGRVDPLLIEVGKLTTKLDEIALKIINIENNGITEVTVDLDTSEDFVDYMNQTYPKALEKLKEICE